MNLTPFFRISPIFLIIAVCLATLCLWLIIDEIGIWLLTSRLNVEPTNAGLERHLDQVLVPGMTRAEVHQQLQEIGPFQTQSFGQDVCSWHPYDPSQCEIEIITLRVGFFHPFAPQRQLSFDQKEKLKYIKRAGSE